MPSQSVKDKKLRSRIREIVRFRRESGRMPSFSELGEITGLRSKNAVSKLVGKLEKLKVLERDSKGKLIPVSIANPVKVLGTGLGSPLLPRKSCLIPFLSMIS
jgi:SOS-response transcriptional repressor LexA